MTSRCNHPDAPLSLITLFPSSLTLTLTLTLTLILIAHSLSFHPFPVSPSPIRHFASWMFDCLLFEKAGPGIRAEPIYVTM